MVEQVSTHQLAVGLSEIEAARTVLDGVAVVTPVEQSRWLSALCGGPVHLKFENLQRTGSFKPRGAYVRMARLSEQERRHGVVAASAGNHAQGVALAAQLLGLHATVFMPSGAPIPKERATRAYGADVLFAGDSIDEALVAARAFADETGASLIHPFDHADIIAGQGTCGLEVAEQVPEASTVIVPTGGGGLIAGMAIALKATRPDLHLVGVQAERAAAYPASLRQGAPTPLSSMRTMADGIAVGMPGQLTFAAVHELVDEVVTVSENALSRALVSLLERSKTIVEPAGAAAVAALMEEPERWETPLVAVLSGGNVDPLLLGKVIRHGMAAAGRYHALRVMIPDSPGGLAGLLLEVSAAGANVIEVVHERTSRTVELGDVEVLIQLETRGPEHAERLIARLRDGGYRVGD